MGEDAELTNTFGDDRTLYTIKDEFGERTTITIDKWAADFLQDILEDVHSWIQVKYTLICNKRSQLSRREKGNLLREVANHKAREHPDYVSFADLL
jgi:hypothetical protein